MTRSVTLLDLLFVVGLLGGAIAGGVQGALHGFWWLPPGVVGGGLFGAAFGAAGYFVVIGAVLLPVQWAQKLTRLRQNGSST